MQSQPIRAVLYLRVATARQENPEAIARQRHACEQRAAELGAVIVAEYVDTGSGLDAERQELQRMLTELDERCDDPEQAISYVIAADHARIARAMSLYASVAWRIEDAGALLGIASTPLSEQPPHGSPAARIAAIAERQHGAHIEKEADE
jgi:DNA invertase Pin-like site-specific DNA recombinase